MTDATTRVGLYEDFERLYERGSGDPVLEDCATLLSLEPVRLAIGKARKAKACRILLLMAAERATGNDARHIRAGAAITGINPESTGRGVRDEPGPLRRREAAGEIDDGVHERTAGNRRKSVYYPAYAKAVLDLVDDLESNETLRTEYLRACGATARLSEPQVSDATSNRMTMLTGVRDDTTVEPQRPNGPGLTTHLKGSAISRPDISAVPLARSVLEALETARATCVTMNRKFATPHLLFALLDLPDSKVAECFEAAQTGLVAVWRDRYQYINDSTTSGHYPAYRPFDWDERVEILRAKERAWHERAPAVTELHLLLGVLDNSKSRTRSRLAEMLVADGYNDLCRIASVMLEEEDTPEDRS